VVFYEVFLGFFYFHILRSSIKGYRQTLGNIQVLKI
ncbi:hypothetical protein pb186bvf_017184, partial [Paramecium bursaria]